MDNYLNPLIENFRNLKSPAIAAAQSKYMRNLFEYIGIKSPLRTELIKSHFAKFGKPEKSKVNVISSTLLNVLMKVETTSGNYTIRQLDTVYQNFLWVPAILLISAVLGLVLKNGIEFRFSVGVLICFVIFFNLVFLLYSMI